MPGRTDEQLVVAAQRGDHHAFDDLMARHTRTAFVTALAYAPDADAAEDVTQDAFVRAWTTIRSCRHGARFGSWLGTIVRRCAINANTKLARRRRILAVFRTDIEESSMSSHLSPDRVTLAGDSQAALALAVQQLAPRQREVLLLHDLEGRSHEEIGGLLGITPSTCRKHLSEARARVRARVQRHPEEVA